MQLPEYRRKGRGIKTGELYAAPEPALELFDVREELPPEEIAWIKQQTCGERPKNWKNRMLEMTWMRWVDPTYLDWMKERKEKLLGECKFDPTPVSGERIDEYLAEQQGLRELARMTEVFPEQRQLSRPDFSRFQKNFFEDPQYRPENLPGIMSQLIQVYPEHRKIIMTLAPQPDYASHYLENCKTNPEGFLRDAERLCLVFPESKSMIDQYVRRTVPVADLLSSIRERAKNSNPRAPFDNVVRYQQMLRHLVILNAAESYIDDTGDIILKPRVPALQHVPSLPPRPHA